MKDISHSNAYRSGKIGWIVLWLLGVPIPILLILSTRPNSLVGRFRTG